VSGASGPSEESKANRAVRDSRSTAPGNISILPNGNGLVLLKADPSSALGAATKQYVDGVASSAITLNKWELGNPKTVLDKLAESLEGGGGTSFIPPFDWVKEKKMNPEVFIYLTDGCSIMLRAMQ